MSLAPLGAAVFTITVCTALFVACSNMGVELAYGWLAQVGWFTALFGAFFLVAHALLGSVWPGIFDDKRHMLRWDTAERCMSIAHSSTCVVLMGYALFALYDPIRDRASGSPLGFQYDSPNSERLVLSLCITNAYMVADLATLWIGAVREGKGDYPISFTVHHVFCVCYAAACLMLGRGGQTAAVATVVAEITNPLQNTWFICKDVPELSGLYARLSPVFTYSFLTVRCLLTPIWSADIIWFCLMQPNSFGMTGPIFAFICAGVNVGGFGWALGLWRGYQRFQAKKAASEQKAA